MWKFSWTKNLFVELECVCCAEIDCVVAKNNQAIEADGLAEPPTCITRYSGFKAICFNRWVLQTAWYQYIMMDDIKGKLS